jgi:RNA polymerase sigma-54 factor
MALEQKLHLKLAQRLVMTPTLQQAIKLLQLSRLELEQAIAQELQSNPLLEQTDDAGQGDGAGAAAAPDGAAGPESVGSQEPTEAAREADPFADVDVDALFANYLHDTARAAATWEDEEEAPLENSPNREASLFDALCAQLRLQTVEPSLGAAAEFVIGNLDTAGYLRMGEQEIADQTGCHARARGRRRARRAGPRARRNRGSVVAGVDGTAARADRCARWGGRRAGARPPNRHGGV